MQKANIAHVWFHAVNALTGIGWDFDAELPQPKVADTQRVVDHIQQTFRDNRGPFYAAMLEFLQDELAQAEEPTIENPVQPQEMAAMIAVNIKGFMAVHFAPHLLAQGDPVTGVKGSWLDYAAPVPLFISSGQGQRMTAERYPVVRWDLRPWPQFVPSGVNGKSGPLLVDGSDPHNRGMLSQRVPGSN